MGLISSYSDDATTTDSDRLLTYAADGSTKLTPASNINKYLGPGWILSGDSWSFSSYSSTTKQGVMNTNSGATTKYSPGMWVQFTQPTLGLKYARVVSATNTTLTIQFYTSSILANEAITGTYYSGLSQPYGAPAPKYTDTNGWTVYDYGNFREYMRAGFTATIAANGFGSSTSVSLPVGETSSTLQPMMAIKNGASQMVGTISNGTSTTVQVDFHNLAGASLTPEAVVVYKQV